MQRDRLTQALLARRSLQAAVGLDLAPRPVGWRDRLQLAVAAGPAGNPARAQRPDEVAAEEGLQTRQGGSAAGQVGQPAPQRAGRGAGFAGWRAGRPGCQRGRKRAGAGLGRACCGVGFSAWRRVTGRVSCGLICRAALQIARVRRVQRQGQVSVRIWVVRPGLRRTCPERLGRLGSLCRRSRLCRQRRLVRFGQGERAGLGKVRVRVKRVRVCSGLVHGRPLPGGRLGFSGGVGRVDLGTETRQSGGPRWVRHVVHRRQAWRSRPGLPRRLAAGEGQQHLADAVHLGGIDAARERVAVVPRHHARQHLIEPWRLHDAARLLAPPARPIRPSAAAIGPSLRRWRLGAWAPTWRWSSALPGSPARPHMPA